ncbi:MAG: hypothetical protein PHD15_02015 [Clostridia bacterium]|nr:hypothetical protein [Clostridia bacterium]MDD4386525.1 hypothetical protein [Clostridia bacterium]
MIREIAIFLIGVVLLLIITAIISNNKKNEMLNDNIEENKETGSENI